MKESVRQFLYEIVVTMFTDDHTERVSCLQDLMGRLDAMAITPDKVLMVRKETGCSVHLAESALESTDGDVTDAILLIVAPPVG